MSRHKRRKRKMEQKNYSVHPSSCVEKSARIGKGTKIWHFCHIREGARIGQDSNIGQNVYIGKDVKVGNHVKLENNVSIYEKVTLEDYVFCGPSSVFTNVINPRSEYPRDIKKDYLPTLVKRGASIGANATVICGNIIGRHAFVGAGAVVTEDVPDYALVCGNPAKVCGWMCRCGTKLEFKKKTAVCKKCRRKYVREKRNRVKPIV